VILRAAANVSSLNSAVNLSSLARRPRLNETVGIELFAGVQFERPRADPKEPPANFKELLAIYCGMCTDASAIGGLRKGFVLPWENSVGKCPLRKSVRAPILLS